jgi:hemerythrin-like domain-containing protein
MSKAIPGHSAPAAGFEAPLEMLSACHGRIEDRCATLRRLQAHLPGHGSDEQARSAAAALIRYFDVAAKQHHDDEEQDLFPALLESMAGSDPVCLRELTARLAAEHRELEARWRRLRSVLARVVEGLPATLDVEQVAAFADLYARHIECEERELLPMAARLLGSDDLDRVGRSMRERRGIAAVE